MTQSGFKTLPLTLLAASFLCAASGADLTFFSCSDTHYNETNGAPDVNAAQSAVIDMLNGLPGQTYPAAVGGGTVATPRGVIVPGDLIDDGQGTSATVTEEWRVWKADFGLTGENRLKFPVYEGYGNHDYNDALLYVENDLKARNLLRANVVARSANGYHYAWDWDGVHFVQLNLFPGTTRTGQSPRNSLNFLRDELAQNVGTRRRPVVIAHHYQPTDGWWTEEEKTYYYTVIRDYNVIAITHGHQGSVGVTKWKGFTVANNHHMLSTGSYVWHITPANELVIVQRTPANAWGINFKESIYFPDLGQAWEPVPSDAYPRAVTNLAQLAWKPGDFALAQSLYFGTSSNAVYASTTPDVSGLGGTATSTPIPAAFLPLQPGTRYYWRVDCQNGTKPDSKGAVWSFRTRDAVQTNELTFLFQSDSHFGTNTVASARTTIAAMNTISDTPYPAAIGGSVKTPFGLIHGGDYTKDGATWEYDVFTNDWRADGEGVLKFPVYETWGNHDENGPDDYLTGLPARHALRPGPLNLSANKLYYSWDWQGVHFVTLGRNPDANSIAFLRDDLAAKVGNTGRAVVLIHHYGMDAYGTGWWSDQLRADYYKVIQDYNIIGIYHGHSHDCTIYQWNGIDVFNAPHELQSYAYGFYVTRIATNQMSVVQRLNTGSWGISLTKPIMMSYASSGIAAHVNNGAGATNITGTSATVAGKLLYQAVAPTDLYVFYGTIDGGTNKSGWSGVLPLGTRGLGEFSGPIAGLAPLTPHYYRCYASNATGMAWASASATFTTLAPADIDNASGATSVRMLTATLNGTLTATSAAPTYVYIYYGTTDGGTTKAGWGNELALGSRPLGAFSQAINGLNMETTYYYRCFASNNVGTRWAAASSALTTQPPVAVDNNPGPTAVTDTTAVLNGNLLITNAAPTSVYVYWGPTDGGTTKTSWANVLDLGSRPLGAFATTLSNLTAQARYYYRAYGSNSVGGRWAASSMVFDTSRDFGPWQKKVKITFKGYNKTEPLINVPLLVVLNSSITNFSYGDFGSPRGTDLIFGDANNAEIPYELEKWDTNGSSYVWVRIPRLESSTNCIWAYWGNPAATNFPAYATNGTVWSEGYAAVWHMGQTNALDSSGNGYHGTATKGTNSAYAVVAGRVGDAVQCPGYGSYITSGDVDVLTNLTMEAFFYTDTNAVVPKNPISKANSYKMNQENVDWMWFHVYGSNVYYNFQYNSGSVWKGNWRYAVMTYDGETGIQRTYLDGTHKGAYTNGLNPLVLNNTAVRLAENYNGIFDEVRISRATRSTNWQWACWLNMASNSVFNGYSSVSNQVVAPKINNGIGASNLGVSSARLNGELLSAGGATTHVWLFWGAVDGGTVKTAWGNSVYLGTRNTGTFSTDLMGLNGLTTYYYRAYASNSVGQTWSSNTTAFITLNADSDGDGLPDAWEIAQFGNLTAANGTTDFDHDGMTDKSEYAAGSSPTNAASIFAFSGSSLNPSGQMVLRWYSFPGKTYTVLQSVAGLGLWSGIVSNLPATPPMNQYTSPPAASGAFYRLISE